jgi:hypothetical protein
MNTTAILVGIALLLAVVNGLFLYYMTVKPEQPQQQPQPVPTQPTDYNASMPPNGYDPSMLPGSIPAGSIPASSMLPGSLPVGSIPAGSIPAGSMPSPTGEFDPSTPPGFGVPPAATTPPGEFDPSTPPGFTPPDPSLAGLSSTSGNPYCDIKFNPFAPDPNPASNVSRPSFPSTIQPLEPNFHMGLSSY